MKALTITRRRIEDALRKGSGVQIQTVAALLGIGCDEETGGHPYAEHTCPKCRAVFCWDCSGRTNIHEGGKHAPDFMDCPVCGHDIEEYSVQVCSDLSPTGEVLVTFESEGRRLTEEERQDAALLAAVPEGKSLREFILELAEKYK